MLSLAAEKWLQNTIPKNDFEYDRLIRLLRLDADAIEVSGSFGYFGTMMIASEIRAACNLLEELKDYKFPNDHNQM
jgi:hypothetical protein